MDQVHAFNGDGHIRQRVEELIRQYNVTCAIETGTHNGETTACLAQMADRVWTIEIDPTSAEKARKRFANLEKVRVIHGDSGQMLSDLLCNVEEPVLFYLDAHWREKWPLLEELRAIARSRVPRVIIAIHDFKVPGLGYDSYGGKELDFDYVQRDIRAIFPHGFTFEQNDAERAAGARRGIAYFHGDRTPLPRTLSSIPNLRIAVLGLYRSGTTAVAGILHHLGVCMGARYWGNYYEPYWLSEQLRQWWDEPKLVARVSAEHRIQVLRRWIQEREGQSGRPSGAKHPLLALCANDLIAAWGSGLRFLWAFRPIEEAITALRSTGWFGSAAEPCQRKLWDTLCDFFRSQPNHKIELSRLRENPENEIERIVDYLGLRPSAQELQNAIRFVQPTGSKQTFATRPKAKSSSQEVLVTGWGIHRNWSAEFKFAGDGRFFGEHPSQHGAWRITADGRTLSLEWDRRPASHLRLQGTRFESRDFTLLPPRDRGFSILWGGHAEVKASRDGRASVFVSYRGQWGNQIFEFAAGRVLAWYAGTPLHCSPIEGFKTTEGLQPVFAPTNPLRTSKRGNGLNLELCAAHLHAGHDVVIDAFHQHYSIYRPWKIQLRAEFAGLTSQTSPTQTTDNDLVLHLRLADEHWQAERGEAFEFEVLFETLRNQKFERLVILTDRPDHAHVQYLRSRYNVEFGPGDKLGDFVTIMRAKRIVLTPSTFGWWAAWLSDAKQILFPRGRGIWRTRRETELWVDDESRYEVY